jgi:recombination associated protein RdgC
MAFTKRASVKVWISPAARLLVIDAGSASRADETLTALTQVLPGLSAQLINTTQSPGAAMADWLVSGEPPSPFSIDRDCELKAADGEKPVVRYARHALDLPEIREHIAAGKRPTRLALTWNDRVSFVLTESLQLKKIAFLDGVFEGRVADGDEGFDANAAIATGELAPMIGGLIDALGGEQVFGEAAPTAATAAASPAAAPAAAGTTPGGADVPPWEAAA